MRSICKTAYSLVFLLAFAFGAHAQTMVQNEWRFLTDSDWSRVSKTDSVFSPNFKDDDFDSRWSNYKPIVTETFYQHLADHLYPGGPNLSGAKIQCRDVSGSVMTFDRSEIDTTLRLLKEGTAYLNGKGFPMDTARFNMVPQVEYLAEIDEDGNSKNSYRFVPSEADANFINILGCEQSSGLALTTGVSGLDAGTNQIAIVPAYDGLKTDAGRYYTLVHELAHVVQNNTMPSEYGPGASGASAKSLTEGSADAIALKAVFDKYGTLPGVLDTIKPETSLRGEFLMRRAYNVPVFFAEIGGELRSGNDKANALINAIDKSTQKIFSYEGRPFYYYLIERYFDGNASRFVDVYSEIQASDSFNIYPKMDHFLDQLDGGVMDGLEHVFPQFLAEYAEWWEDIYKGKLPESHWLNRAFGGCAELPLDPKKNVATATRDFSEFAGGCYDIIISKDLAKRRSEIELLVTSPDGDVNDIYLGVARKTGLKDGDEKCTDARSINFKAPCLTDPHDSVLDDPFTIGDVTINGLVRGFHIQPFVGHGETPIIIRVILADVPTDLDAITPQVARAYTYRLTAAIDSTVVDSANGGFDADTNTSDEQVSGPSVTATEGRISSGEADDPTDFTQFMSGGVRFPGVTSQTLDLDPSTLTDSQFYMIEVQNDEADGQQDTLLFARNAFFDSTATEYETISGGIESCWSHPGLFRNSPTRVEGEPLVMVEPYETGAVDIAPLFIENEQTRLWRNQGITALTIQDPLNPSTLDIFEHTDASLIYEAQINACVIPSNRLIDPRYKSASDAIVQRAKDQIGPFPYGASSCDEVRGVWGMTIDIYEKTQQDLAILACGYGERVSYRFQSTIAFPALLQPKYYSRSRLAFPERTPELKAYQEIRASRVAEKLGMPLESVGIDTSNDPSVTDPLPWKLSAASGPQSQSSSNSSNGESKSACDCTCEGKDEFDALTSSGSLPSSQNFCKLGCAKTWRSCQP